MDIKNVKGTHDIILEEAKAYDKIEMTMKSFAEAFCFSEFRTPVIEPSELFQRSVGESSDVVRKEMYTFLDKGDRLLALRPEFTAGIVRSFVNNKLYATRDLPLKAYYSGPVFRYERPQQGRYRQFHQFGVESLGVENVLNDVESLFLGYVILTALGLENVTLKINTLGDASSREAYRNALKGYFESHIKDMCDDCKVRYEVNPLRILDCKVPSDHEIVLGAPKMSDYLSNEAKAKFNKVLIALDEMNIPYEIDDTLVRGLDYYSELVFEYHYTSKKGVNYGAIGAGGHYDNLVEELDGPKMAGVGFSFGIERVYSVLKDDGLLDDIVNDIDIYVMPLSEKAKNQAFYLTSGLRTSGYKTEINLVDSKMANMFKKADRHGAKLGIIIGDDEIANGTVIVKDLAKKEQEEVAIDDLLDKVDAFFGEGQDECCCGDGECHCHDHEGE